MLYIHERMAELWLLQKNSGGNLTEAHQKEMLHCLEMNLKYVRQYQELCNLSLIAYEVNDQDWLHKICAKIDALELAYKLKGGKHSDV